MRIETKVDEDSGHTEIVGLPGQYDAVPPYPILVYGSPQGTCNDRTAVACALMFHDMASGELVFDSATCSRHVGNAISRFFLPVDLVVQPQSMAPRAGIEGTRTVRLLEGAGRAPSSGAWDPGDLLFRLVPGGIGHMLSTSEFALGTNLGSYSCELNQGVDEFIRHLGVLVMFAERVRAGRIVAPVSKWPAASRALVEKAVELTRSVNLQVCDP